MFDAALRGGKDAVSLLTFEFEMVRADDLGWIVEALRASPDAASRTAWSELAARVFHPDSATELNAVIGGCAEFPELQAALRYWLDPVDLCSAPAKISASAGGSRRVRTRARSTPEPPRVDGDGVLERLKLSEGGVFEAFAQLTLDLLGSERGAGSADVLDPDLRSLPGWSADQETGGRIVNAAKAYLETADPHPERWLGTTRLSIPALAGYKALVAAGRRSLLCE